MLSELLDLYGGSDFLLLDLVELGHSCNVKKEHLIYDKRDNLSYYCSKVKVHLEPPSFTYCHNFLYFKKQFAMKVFPAYHCTFNPMTAGIIS